MKPILASLLQSNKVSWTVAAATGQMGEKKGSFKYGSDEKRWITMGSDLFERGCGGGISLSRPQEKSMASKARYADKEQNSPALITLLGLI